MTAIKESIVDADTHGVLKVLGKRGDTKTIWNPLDEDEVSAARKTFEDLKEKGFKAFKVGKDGKTSEEMKKFSKKAGAVIMVPPMAGG